MANSVTLRVKIDADLKKEAEKIFKDIGLSAGDAIRIFYKQVVIHHGMPFEISAKKENNV